MRGGGGGIRVVVGPVGRGRRVLVGRSGGLPPHLSPLPSPFSPFLDLLHAHLPHTYPDTPPLSSPLLSSPLLRPFSRSASPLSPPALFYLPSDVCSTSWWGREVWCSVSRVSCRLRLRLCLAPPRASSPVIVAVSLRRANLESEPMSKTPQVWCCKP